ncbi:hypothetical protein YB2330_004733 [Saitoella coloradoensis]
MPPALPLRTAVFRISRGYATTSGSNPFAKIKGIDVSGHHAPPRRWHRVLKTIALGVALGTGWKVYGKGEEAFFPLWVETPEGLPYQLREVLTKKKKDELEERAVNTMLASLSDKMTPHLGSPIVAISPADDITFSKPDRAKTLTVRGIGFTSADGPSKTMRSLDLEAVRSHPAYAYLKYIFPMPELPKPESRSCPRTHVIARGEIIVEGGGGGGEEKKTRGMVDVVEHLRVVGGGDGEEEARVFEASLVFADKFGRARELFLVREGKAVPVEEQEGERTDIVLTPTPTP